MSWALPIGAALLIGLTILAAILLLSSRGTSKSGERQIDEAAGGRGGGGETPQVVTEATAAMAASSPIPATSRKTGNSKSGEVQVKEAAEGGGGGGGGETTQAVTEAAGANALPSLTPPTAPPLPAEGPLSPNSMLCIFGATLDPKMTFPEDGLCDYSFFQAVEKEGLFLEGNSGGASLDAFTATAAKHSKTEYGISLDFK
ncbi:hypothetical protein V5799_015232 [Amblyomma americanum]|uniref:Uncharacterized protein n=1 Tax=Amblyomma americanum TaxID=6943 RepID=A0AAQ4E0R5_AMBAM